MGQAGANSDRNEQMKISAEVLNIALADLAKTLAGKFITHAGERSPLQIFKEVARHHLKPKTGS